MSNPYRAHQIKVHKKQVPLSTRGTIKIDVLKAAPKKVVSPLVPSPIPASRQVSIGRKLAEVKPPPQPIHNLNFKRIAQQAAMPAVRRRGIVQDEQYHSVMALKNVGVGKTLVMIACGPSTLEVDFTPIVGHKAIDVMVINKPFKQVWPSKYWAFCDQSQYIRNKEEFDRFGGTLITSTAVAARRRGQVIVKAKQILHGNLFSKDLTDGYVIGRSSVYANMQTALWMNYDKVYIFGVDMAEVNGSLHHYGVNPDVPPATRLERFKHEAKNYDKLATVLTIEIRKKFYFCSSYNPWSFPELFNKLDHKKAIAEILK